MPVDAANAIGGTEDAILWPTPTPRPIGMWERAHLDGKVAAAARECVAALAAFDDDRFSTDPALRCRVDAAWLELVAACTEPDA